jgi:hypothetical protein
MSETCLDSRRSSVQVFRTHARHASHRMGDSLGALKIVFG